MEDIGNWLGDIGMFATVVVFAAYIVLKDMGIIKSKGDDRRKSEVPPIIKDHIETLNGSVGRIKNIEELIYEQKKKVDDLYKWHDQRDSDGAFAWYVRKSLETAINKLADNIEKQTAQNTLETQTLVSLAAKIDLVSGDVKSIKNR